MAEKKDVKPAPRFDLVVPVDNHTHAGAPVEKGSTIKVTAKQKERLEKLWNVQPAA